MTEAEVRAWVSMAQDGTLNYYLNQRSNWDVQIAYERELRRRANQ